MSTKATAARIYEYGEPDVFRFETMDVPDPVGHEVLVRNTVIGLNFVDIYYRRGTLPVPEFPAIIGDEASGVVEAVGPNVTLVKVGAGWPTPMRSVRLYPEDRLTVIPDGVTDDQAASSLLKGLSTLPAEGNRSTPRRRYRPVPRCSWWSGSDLHTVGKIAWD
jgi:NADPH2:quinone reductase